MWVHYIEYLCIFVSLYIEYLCIFVSFFIQKAFVERFWRGLHSFEDNVSWI